MMKLTLSHLPGISQRSCEGQEGARHDQLPPAAQALVQALADQRLDALARAALVAALTGAMARSGAPPGRLETTPAAPPARARQRAAPQRIRKAEAISFGKESVDALTLPSRGERYVYDTACPQLGVRLRPGGKSYVVSMWDGARGRSVRVTLGKVERLTPENARKRARELVAEVSRGVDIRRPAVDGLTVAGLLEKWHAEKARSVRTANELRTKALYYLGRLAHRQAGEVTRENIGTIHTKIATEARRRVRKRVGDSVEWTEIGPVGLPATADKWRAAINAVFQWGIEKGLVHDNPAAGIGAAFDSKGAQRTRYLHGDDLLRFWKALEGDRDGDTRDALLLLLHAGQRRGNVLAMRWADLDLRHGLWSLGAADTKQGKAQTTPLTAQAREVLQRRQHDAARPWVFSATRAARRGRPIERSRDRNLGAMSEARLRDAWMTRDPRWRPQTMMGWRGRAAVERREFPPNHAPAKAQERAATRIYRCA